MPARFNVLAVVIVSSATAAMTGAEAAAAVPARPDWAVTVGAGAYFGIDGGQAQAALAHGVSLPVHAADAGLRDASLSLVAAFRLVDRWSVQALFRAERLLGDAAASPVVERRFQPVVGALVAYRLR